MNYSLNEIRNYILENRMRWSYYNPSGDPLMDASAIADSAGHIAQNALSISSSYAEKQYRYEQDFENIKKKIIERAENEAVAKLEKGSSNVAIAQARKEAYDEYEALMSKDGFEKSDMLTKSRDYKLLRMGHYASNIRLATESVAAARATVENVIAISSIVRDKVKEKNLSKSVVMEAGDILDQAYRIKQEGEQNLKNIDLELKKLQESFFGSVIEKIKNLFKKNKTESDILLQKAKKLKGRK